MTTLDCVMRRHSLVAVSWADYLCELSEKELKAARKVLDAARVKHDMVVRTGHVATEIVALAKSGKYDLLVLGAKGEMPWPTCCWDRSRKGCLPLRQSRCCW
jgi:nucleotide-binding universal stress UspA family protein